jgi:H(+)-translocating pyrophosphatase
MGVLLRLGALFAVPVCAKPVLDLTDMDEFPQTLVAVAPLMLFGIFSIIFVAVLGKMLWNKKTGKHIDVPKLDRLAAQIHSGSLAFLKEEYKYLAVYVIVWAVLLVILFTVKPNSKKKDGTDGVRCCACFIAGAGLSALSGFIGMKVATAGNVRTAVACASGTLNNGLRVAFTAGSCMGFGVVGLAATGLSVMLLCMSPNRSHKEAVQYLHSFGFGASSIALFARVAGGIYTKAADVGADLVGKVEAGIDEDDPHNPAVIADNVGDNVGDVAGMGADLFESYVGSLLGAATLGATMTPAHLAFPFWLMAAGLLTSFIGYFFVNTNEKGDGVNTDIAPLMWALDKGMLVANGLFVILSVVIVILLFGHDEKEGWKLLGCVVIGMVTGMAIGKATEYFTSFDYGPTISIKDRARTGPATVIIQGIGVGMISTLLPTLFLAGAILGCAALSNEYGVACAAVGMLATLAISLSTDAYGPVADNAGGLAEMAHLGHEVRAKTDALDALGNTTAAIGKGFAVGSAVLTSLSLVAAFKEEVCHADNTVCFANGKFRSYGGGTLTADSEFLIFEVSEPILLAGVLVGAMLPYLFGALTMLSVGKAAAEMIEEVRRQFRTLKNANGVTLIDIIKRATKGEIIPEDEDIVPDSDRCVMISTRSSVKEMLAPGLYAVLTPLVVGFLVGPRAVMGLLAGTIGSAAMLAVMMGNSGGAWDNAKKLCEKLKLKKTEQGKACVVGDTVGDPFKDTSGPSLDILLKLMSMVALLIAPLMQGKEDWDDAWIGIIPLVVIIVASIVLWKVGILTWADPLANAKIDSESDDNLRNAAAKEQGEVSPPSVAVAAGQRPGSGGGKPQQAWSNSD